MTLERQPGGEAPSELPTATSRDSTRRVRHVPGEPGLWILLFADLLVFCVLFAVFLNRRGEQPGVFAASQGTLNRDVGALNTLVLLTSSLLVVMATDAVRREPRRQAPHLILGAIGCGVCFIVLKVFEYQEKFAAGITPGTNQFYMYYWVLTGLHLAHVVVGLAVLTGLWTLARRPALGKVQLALFEGGACFWHMVDLLWIVLFPLLYFVE